MSTKDRGVLYLPVCFVSASVFCVFMWSDLRTTGVIVVRTKVQFECCLYKGSIRSARNDNMFYEITNVFLKA